MNPMQKQSYGLKTVLPSTAPRAVATSSKSHMAGIFVIDNHEPRILLNESHLEHLAAMCLWAQPDTDDMYDHVPFYWIDVDGEGRTHYFDLVVTTKSGPKIAYTVRPKACFKGKLAEELPLIASQAIGSGEYADVRLLTDQDLDPINIFNAALMYASRRPEEDVDREVNQRIEQLQRPITLGELTQNTNQPGQSFRAAVRAIRSGRLCLTRHERITHGTQVFAGGLF